MDTRVFARYFCEMDPVALIETRSCPTCDAPAGSPCRTRDDKIAPKYHTPRLLQVPALRDEIEVPTRTPGAAWHPPHRIGYTTNAALPHCVRTFTDRAAALTAARSATLVVARLDHLAGTSHDLVAVAATMHANGTRLDVLDGPLTGLHTHDGMFFEVLTAAADLDRAQRRARIRAGQAGTRNGRPRIFDDELLAQARALRADGVPVPQIARRLVTKSGHHPSVASVYRALSEPTLVAP